MVILPSVRSHLLFSLVFSSSSCLLSVDSLCPQAIIHPDTGEKIPMPFRMSGKGVSVCVCVCVMGGRQFSACYQLWRLELGGRGSLWTDLLAKVTLSWALIKPSPSCCLEVLLGHSEIGVF